MNEVSPPEQRPKPVPEHRPALIHKIFYMADCRGISQSDLARKLGLTSSYLSSWKFRHSVPNSDQLVALSRVFGVELLYLMDSAIPKEDVTA